MQSNLYINCAIKLYKWIFQLEIENLPHLLILLEHKLNPNS